MNVGATFFGGMNKKEGENNRSNKEVLIMFIAIGYLFIHKQ